MASQSALDQIFALAEALPVADQLELDRRLRYQRTSKCRLLSLPPELRNRIWYLAALDALRTYLRCGKQFPLQVICYQIRNEFSSIY